MLDEELLTGKQFIPGVTLPTGSVQPQFRSVLRKVIDCSPLIAGANVFPHGIVFDGNFTLIDLWISATKSTVVRSAQIITGNSVTMDSTNINITSPGAFDRAFAFVEYLQEL